MANVEFNLNQSALHQVGMNKAHVLVTDVTRRTFNRSAVLCPVDFGRLRASGSPRVMDRGSAVVGEIEYTADYAAAVHNGRRAMTIRARNRRYLRFTVGGRVVYARQVHQPARPARPFLTDALRQVAGAEGFEVQVSIG